MKNKTEDGTPSGLVRGFILGMGVASTIIFPIREAIKYSDKIIISKDVSMEDGFVEPGKLELKLKDINKNGKKEFIFEYESKKYLLCLDKENNPILKEYVLKPAINKPGEYLMGKK